MTPLLIACLWFGHCDTPPESFSPEPIVYATEHLSPEELLILAAIEDEAPTVSATYSSTYQPPAPTFTPDRTAFSGDVEQWRPLVAGHFPPDQVDTALCVISGESGGNPNAKNSRSSAAGLWQFIKSTWDSMVHPHLGGATYAEGGPYSPELSTLYAAWLWNAEGWTQWSAYRHCD